MPERDCRFHGCSPCATIFFYKCALLPSSASNKDDNERSLNAPLISFFFFCDFTARRPCMPMIVHKTLSFAARCWFASRWFPPPPSSVSRSSRPQSNLAQTGEELQSQLQAWRGCSADLSKDGPIKPPALVLQAVIHTVN